MADGTTAETGLATLYVPEDLHEKVKAIAWITKRPMHALTQKYLAPVVERDFTKLFPNGIPKPEFKRQRRAA